MKGTIGRATAWSSGTELAAKLVAPLVNMILARLLTPEAFGAVATVTVIISFAELFADAGFQKYLVWHEFSSPQEQEESSQVAFWTNLALSGMATAVIVLFRHRLAALVGSPELGDAIGAASFSIVLYAFSGIQMALYKRAFDFKTLFFVRIGSALIPLLVTVPLALWLRNYWALVIGTLVTNAVSALVLTLCSSWKPRWFYDVRLLRRMISYSGWLYAESLLTWLVSAVDVFLVGRFLNDREWGLYKTATATVNSYLGLITAAVLPVLFSALSRVQTEELSWKTTFYRFQRFAGVWLIPMGIGLFVFRDTATRILLGDQWSEAADFIGVWSLMTVAVMLTNTFFGEAFRSKGRPRVALYGHIIHLAFLIPVVFLSAQQGFETLYLARSLVRIQSVLTGFLFARVLYGFRVRDTLKNLGAMLVSAGIMGLAGEGLRGLCSAFWWQITAAVLCVGIYFGILSVFPSVRRDRAAGYSWKRLREKEKTGSGGNNHANT